MKWPDTWINAIQDTTRLLRAGFALLGPWLAPLGPAVFFGVTMAGAAETLHIVPWLVIMVGIVTAASLEAINIAAAHAAIELWHHRDKQHGRYDLARLLILFYVVLGIGAMFALPVPWSTRIVGGALFLLTPVSITAQALILDLARMREETDTRQAREDERRLLAAEERKAVRAQEDKRLELEFEVLKIEQIKARSAARIAKAQAGTERPEHVPVKNGTGSLQARAAAVLELSPDLSGDALGLALGISGGYGRKLKRRWLAADRNGRG